MLGSIKMPDIDVVGNIGGSFEVEATFDVADVGHLTEFTKTMLTKESFEWVISGKNLSGTSHSGHLSLWLADLAHSQSPPSVSLSPRSS